jgi:magnesium-transporting ATPase (P-type)
MTMAFVTVAVAELVLVFSLRSGLRPAWQAARNPLLEGAVALSAVAVALLVYLPLLHDPVGTVSLGAAQLAVALALAVAPAAAVELAKRLVR